MIAYNADGTKVDLNFEFISLKLGVGFPCEIMIFMATNYEHTRSECVPFDHQRF